ncbi:hypothetical protein [Cypionkella psychrotolerans]|uniref:hypothetical protein n=1 Tax=Cypionkella psychrotolerans TaxID=1678131 RepID=UPI0006B4F9B6|nr:hypothetical protein [Cypionkella psychrotolerans]
MSQVFVLGTDRCGSKTFTVASEHMTNFTAEHDSRTHILSPNRFAYPDNHLAWWTGKLVAAFGDTPLYVHLSRDRDAW